MDKTEFKGKNVFITGASQGLGYAIAKGFLQNGANVFLCARSKTKLQKVYDEFIKIKEPSQKIIILPIDLSKEDQCEKAVEYFFHNFTKVDILINNAGIIGPKGPLENSNWLEWKYAMNINLFGSIYLIFKFLPHFKEQNSGTIIQLSGGGATSPLPYMSAYATSKAALIRFIETISLELKEFNITANSIAPGPLNTRILDEFLEAGPKNVGEEFYKKALLQKETGGAPLKKAVDLCLYLASETSPKVTGKLISAIWDDWENIKEFFDELKDSDVYTIRRITAKDRSFSWGDL